MLAGIVRHDLRPQTQFANSEVTVGRQSRDRLDFLRDFVYQCCVRNTNLFAPKAFYRSEHSIHEAIQIREIRQMEVSDEDGY